MTKKNLLIDFLVTLVMIAIVINIPENIAAVIESIAYYILVVLVCMIPLGFIGLTLYRMTTNTHSKEARKNADDEYKRDLKERPWRF